MFSLQIDNMPIHPTFVDGKLKFRSPIDFIVSL